MSAASDSTKLTSPFIQTFSWHLQGGARYSRVQTAGSSAPPG